MTAVAGGGNPCDWDTHYEGSYHSRTLLGPCLGHSSRCQTKKKPRGHELQSQGVQEEVLIFVHRVFLNGLDVEGADLGNST